MLFHERLKQRMLELGIRNVDIAKLANVSPVAARKWVIGESVPTAVNLKIIAKALKTTDDWLLTGKESPQSQLSTDQQISDFLDGSTQAVTTDDLSQDEQSEKIWIDMYDVQFCSGVGVPVEFQFDQIKKQLSFEPSFFVKRNINKKNFRIIINKGDSNEEYLFDGDAVGIDISDTDIVDGETYALYFEGDALIRKIFKEQGGMLRLHPRNPKYQDKIVDTKLENIESSFKIIGRVRYRSG